MVIAWKLFHLAKKTRCIDQWRAIKMKSTQQNYHLFLALITFPFLFTACSGPNNYINKNKSEVIIINKTGEPLASGTLSISNHLPIEQVATLDTNAITKVNFENFGDGQYGFAGTFQSGRTLRDSTGYVTNGMNFEDTLILIKIFDSLGLELKSKKASDYNDPSNKYDNNPR
jgi:hypothetical protein